MRYLAIFISAVAFAAVDGTVVNRTTGKPQPGAAVVLINIGAQGMQPAGSATTDAQGRFRFDRDVEGTALLQVSHQGVTYNHHLQPGAATTGQELSVYNASKEPGEAKLATHTLILEPGGAQLNVTESFFFNNTGTTTFRDPDTGTLRFFLPRTAQPPMVMATGPQGMPVQRQPKTQESGVYSVDYPIKPGETRFDVRYSMPFQSPGVFAGKSMYGTVPVRVAVPNGVMLAGDGVRQLGQEPSSKANIYEVAGASFKLALEGTGALRAASPGASQEEEEEAGPRIQQIMPRVYDRVWWIVAATLLALACGFVILYRKGSRASA